MNGITVAYEATSRAPDVLLLIHGHPFNRSMWAPQLAAVEGAGWQAIVPDLRGYGETTVVPGVSTLEVLAEDLGGLLDALGIGAIAVGGLSMGGQIAMEFCRRYPQRVRGLLLAATFPQAETVEGRRRRQDMAERLLREGMGNYAREVLPKMLGARSIAILPDVASKVLAMMVSTSPIGAAAALRGRAERPPYEPVLATTTCPALVVVGSEDAFTSRDDVDCMMSLLRNADLSWLPDVGHMPNLEAPKAFNTSLTKFLRRIVFHEAAMTGARASNRDKS